jgi:hypothetical protein
VSISSPSFPFKCQKCGTNQLPATSTFLHGVTYFCLMAVVGIGFAYFGAPAAFTVFLLVSLIAVILYLDYRRGVLHPIANWQIRADRIFLVLGGIFMITIYVIWAVYR